MPLQVGIIGLPNVGKSTLFNALTGADVASENYPFTTIDPNLALVPIPDNRLNEIARIAQPEKVVPASVEFVDIAGLVAGAAAGEGLGNRFLGKVREVNALAHVTRCFDDPDIAHVSQRIDPVADIEVVETELILADLETMERAIDRVTRRARTGNPKAQKELSVYQIQRDHLAQGGKITSDFTLEKDPALRELHLLTSIPVMYIANVSDPDDGDSPYVSALRDFAAVRNTEVLTVAAALESEISELDETDRGEFRKALGQESSGLDRIVSAAYRLLGLSTFFTTTGGRELRAWIFPPGTTAFDAAGMIHTDFAHGFVRAEIISYDDYVSLGGEHNARSAGKVRTEGRDSPVRDGDLIHFRANP